jgi:hypothetical protein
MKKFLLAVSMLAFAGSAMAQHYHGFRHHGHHGHHRGPGFGWWVAPVVVGAIGYELGRQQVIVQQPPVVVQSLPAQPSQNCTPWTETQHSDGTITRTRTCAQ